ncbi:MAG TPA: cupredoxin domain-containing protein [Candidatus Binatia bacterium]|nr:cupredoxin domain-containing protein [Candidatus Binatia bacterium]
MRASGSLASVSRRDVLRASVLGALSLVAAACAAPAAPSWTFAPPAGSVPPRPAGSAAAKPPASGLLIRIVAENFAFDLAEFSVPADTPFQIEFDHRDVRIPHNVAIYDSGPEGPPLFRGEIFSGPDIVTYDVPGLPRGEHAFTCDPHPYMLGVVTVT